MRPHFVGVKPSTHIISKSAVSYPRRLLLFPLPSYNQQLAIQKAHYCHASFCIRAACFSSSYFRIAACTTVLHMAIEVECSSGDLCILGNGRVVARIYGGSAFSAPILNNRMTIISETRFQISYCLLSYFHVPGHHNLFA